MTLSVKTEIRNQWLSDIADNIDDGAGNGVLNIYSGVRPSTGDAATGDLLASLQCSKPCYSSISNGVLTFDSFTDDSDTDNTGTATWARITDSDGNFVIDIDVGESGSGADIILNSVSIFAGGILRINSGSISTGNA